jgi:hypothetical protein
MHAFLFLLFACSLKDKTPDDPSENGDGGGGYPSDFSTGGYRMSAFTILGAGEGKDWNGDGTLDNNLPNVLTAFGFFLEGYDLSKDGLNTIAADAIDNDTLVLLIDARYDDADLTLDFLAGVLDGDGNLQVDEDESYDSQGEPISRMVGRFVSENTYTAGPNSIVLPIPVDAAGTPAPFPLEDVRMDGNLGAITLDGTIVGIVPVAPFVEGVLPIFIPEAGFDLDGDDEIGEGETQADLIALVTGLLNTSADVETSAGAPGISAAVHFSAGAAVF